MKYAEFKQKWEQQILPIKSDYIRDGQSLINFLGDIWLEEYKKISSVDYCDKNNIDCFYNDSLIPNTLKHLDKVWENYPK